MASSEASSQRADQRPESDPPPTLEGHAVENPWGTVTGGLERVLPVLERAAERIDEIGGDDAGRSLREVSRSLSDMYRYAADRAGEIGEDQELLSNAPPGRVPLRISLPEEDMRLLEELGEGWSINMTSAIIRSLRISSELRAATADHRGRVVVEFTNGQRREMIIS